MTTPPAAQTAPPPAAPQGPTAPASRPPEEAPPLDPLAQLAALKEMAEALDAHERRAEALHATGEPRQAPMSQPPIPQGPPTLPAWVGDIARRAPRLLQGEDRLKFYIEQIEQVAVEKREALRDFVEGFVAQLHEMKASDMDFGGPACVGRVWYRVDGDKKPYHEIGAGSTDEIDIVILNLLSPRQREDLFTVQSADFSYYLPTPGGGQRRFRCTCYFDAQHLGLCMRAINETVRPLDSLGFHPLIQRGMMFRHVRDGLTLFTGVTGSGKSTSLDAIIDANNHDFDGHIVIVAKPIEYMHLPDRCIIRHREVGPDVPSFKDGVTQALRQDPDIIMIGEMRDPETISAAIEASDTGHKVFSTLHTSSAVESLDRIVAEYPHEEQDRIRIRLGDVLRCVVSQKLAPRPGGGRVLVKEVLWVTANVKAAILNGNTGEIYQMMWEGGKQGMITLEQDLVRLVRERKITPEVGLQYANNKRRFRQLLG
ncbi:MAG: type IV pilus twitching motility protein PilT [Rubricoccaceae bacterium]|nr:type IV pilus twitching motility protein PilT [Rubricoccaceae bacterium]